MNVVRSLCKVTVYTASQKKASLCYRATTAALSFLSWPIAFACYPIQHILNPLVQGLYKNIAKDGKPVDYEKYGRKLSNSHDIESLQQHVVLPNKAEVNNRLVKSGITDGLCTLEGNPTPQMVSAYKRYASGGYGMIISSDTSVDRRCRLPGATGHTPIFDSQSDLKAFTNLAEVIKCKGSLAILQLTHPGPVVPFSDYAYAPSLIIADSPRGIWSQVARSLTDQEISSILEMFLKSAKLAEQCKFDGIQLVASNGYLPALFLNRKINTRSGKWQSNAFVVNLLKALLAQRTNQQFSIGIKLNSSDLQEGGFSPQEAADLILIISELGIDFIEIGGGNCQKILNEDESKARVSQEKETSERQAYFNEFAKKVLPSIKTPLMMTGEWRDPREMGQMTKKFPNVLIGLGRPVCIDPDVGNKVLNGHISHIPSWFQEYMPPFVAEKLKRNSQGAKELAHGIEIVWHALAVAKIANGDEIPKIQGIFDKPQNALGVRVHMLIRAILPRKLLSYYLRKPPLAQKN